MLTKNEAIPLLNRLAGSSTAFSFYCDFKGERWCIEENATDSPGPFRLSIAQLPAGSGTERLVFEKFPIAYEQYRHSFDHVVSEINYGNSFLTNLTFKTRIETNLSLEEIYSASKAKYKLLVPGHFVVFSPETFIKIHGNQIFSYPMKGTIDAATPYARERILADVKETAEHVTIVDLLRNDLSQVAEKVEVSKFRYLEEIETNQKRLLQVSSEIRGKLPPDWKKNLGEILSQLLPAGSISGAPKPQTLEIIEQNESYDRGFYTGICGHFDGQSLDTGVMIRFIKEENNQFFYCSGGGITSFSEPEKEYREMVDKIYLAI